MILHWKRLHPAAVAPARSTAGAAGYDLTSVEEVTLHRFARVLVHCGIAIAVPPGYVGDVRPRSGLAVNRGVTVLNSPGTIDSDFRGEVCVLLVNHGDAPHTVTVGQRIAQLVITMCEAPDVEEVKELDETERGAGGFGSTGA